MAIEKTYLKIIDTETNLLVDTEEYTAISGINLVYASSEDKYQPIMGSQLNFNMLVETAEDGKFLHLFTGNETRYKLILQDYTDNLNPIDLWQGYLLGDQYSEPYENGSFFVNFTATDGIGRIKSSYLGEEFYYQTKSLSAILCECLRLTGNSFSLAYAPAIENTMATVRLDQLEINTLIFEKKGKRKNAYKILEEILKTLGCKLFQWKKVWYVIGINRMHEINLETYNFTSAGVYVNYTTLKRLNTFGVFEATPNITIMPPNKLVSIEWDADEQSNVLPKDIVYQALPNLIYKTGLELLFVPLKYWTKTNAGAFSAILSGLPTNPNADWKIEGGPFYINLWPYAALSNVSSTYVSLTNPVYVNGSYSGGDTVDLNIKGSLYFSEDVQIKFDAGDFKQKLFYNVLLNGTTLVSNNTTFDAAGNYDYELSYRGLYNNGITDYYIVDFSFELNDIYLTENGYVDIRLHPIQEITDLVGSQPTTIYTNCSIDYTGDYKKDIELVRDIDFTGAYNLNLQYGISENELLTNRITPSSNVSFSSYLNTTATYNQIITPIGFISGTSYTLIQFSKWDYEYMLKHKNKIQFDDVTAGWKSFTNFYLFKSDDYGYVIYTTDAILETDLIRLYFAAVSETVTDKHLLNAYWKRYGITEAISYKKALAKIYHNVLPIPNKKIEGSLFGLFGPLDLIEFYYLNPDNYQMSGLKMDFSTGLTNVLLLETNNENITDYVNK